METYGNKKRGSCYRILVSDFYLLLLQNKRQIILSDIVIIYNKILIVWETNHIQSGTWKKVPVRAKVWRTAASCSNILKTKV